MAKAQFEWRGDFANQELSALHAEAFAHAILDLDWTSQVKAHSLGWVTARDSGKLIGFVNVAWDGDTHAFILDTIVSASRRRQGIGTWLIAVATAEARAAGCEWLHVDFDEEHGSFYLDACGFEPAAAGIMALKSTGQTVPDAGSWPDGLSDRVAVESLA
jgi:GNAT superfamily N-acetyltransferase